MNDDTSIPVVQTVAARRGGRRKAYLAATLAVAGSLAAVTAVGFAGNANAETPPQAKTQIGELYPYESTCEQALTAFDEAGNVPYDGYHWSFSEGMCWEWGEAGDEYSLRVVLGERIAPISP